MFENIIDKYFSSLNKRIRKSFVRCSSGVINACSFSTHEIARHISKATGKDFNTSEKGLNYLLSNDLFQIDDNYWRLHINMIFNLLLEQNIIKKNEKIYIQVDFTSNKDNFLILCASIIINNRAVPLYFTMRNYPKRKNQYNHKKMESAFLKGLKHLLSKKYQYIIVADRGFGNKRFIELCEENDFNYLIRLTSNMKVESRNNIGIINDVCKENGKYEVNVLKWSKNITVYKSSIEAAEPWYLVSNIDGLNSEKASSLYSDRFKIEKCFQDMKSSGFNMEKSKIRKYSKYKKLLALCALAHALLVLLGHLIVVKMPHFLKNSADILS